MKTYEVNTDVDICNKLIDNNIKHLNNSFEMSFKDVKKFIKRSSPIGTDMIVFDAHVIPLTMQQSDSSFSLVRKNSKNFFVNFVNIKNENDEYLSSEIDGLSEHHKFLIIDGVVLKLNPTFNQNKLTIAVQPENNPSVFLFKYGDSLKPSENYLNVLAEKNLSKITDCGVYSLFGHIINTIKYIDEELMLIRLQCYDKSVIKIRKYPECVCTFKNISKEEITAGVKYDCSSKFVDILIKNPCADFITLKTNQRIFLNEVIVKYSNDLKIFSLYAMGETKNLKADPLQTGSVKSLRPPVKFFPIPNELKPVAQIQTKQNTYEKVISKNNDQNSKTNVHVLKNTKKLSLKKLPLNVEQSKHRKLSSSSSDDNVDLSHYQNFLTSKHNLNTNNIINKDTNNMFCKTNNFINCSPVKNTNLNSVNNKVQKCNTSTPKKQQICLESENSKDSTDGTCSPSFLKTSEMPKFNQENRLTKLDTSNNICTRSTQYIGSCRLLHVESKLDNIVYGYCTKCFVFSPQTFLIKLNLEKYRCPDCFNIVNLTFFFKMIFLYGSNEHHAIEVWCYNENAERVLKKLLKKKMKLEDYLTSSKNRKLFEDVVGLLIRNHTKMNIVVCYSPNDNIYILQSIDTEFIVTTPVKLI